MIDEAEPVAQRLLACIKQGDVDQLRAVLAEDPALATAQLCSQDGHSERQTRRSLLHVATDWPGHLPNVRQTIATLIAAGSDPNARCYGPHSETPLHWAASSDDVAAIDALIEAGADLEAPGAVIAGGTPMADATAFGQWSAARRLLDHGATTNLFEAATLGLTDRVRVELQAMTDPEQITHALWGACHGGQRATAELLLAHGADLNWQGWDELTPLDAALRSEANGLADWLRQQGVRSADDS